MSSMPESDWDALRFEVLRDLGELDINASEAHQALAVAMTLAFDAPVPNFTVYQKLRSFNAGLWPLLRKVLASGRQDVDEVMTKATDMLNYANALRDKAADDTLAVQVEVLKTLIKDLRT